MSQTLGIKGLPKVYAHDTTAGERHGIATNLLANLWHEGGGGVSVQVLQELYATLTRKVKGMTAQTARELVETYAHWRTHHHQPTGTDVVAAIDLHQKHQLSFRDAMVIHSAARLGCEQLYSEDLNSGQLVLGVQVLKPFIQKE